MKLSKKSSARQRAIAKALASGKALGGLLAGLAAAVFTGCREKDRFSVAGGISDCSDTRHVEKANAANEKHRRDASVRGKYVIEPEEGNKGNETNEVFTTLGEIVAEPKPNAKNEKEPIWEEGGDVQTLDD